MKLKYETMSENKNMVVLRKTFELTGHQNPKQIYFGMFWKKRERKKSQRSAPNISEWLKDLFSVHIWTHFSNRW